MSTVINYHLRYWWAFRRHLCIWQCKHNHTSHWIQKWMAVTGDSSYRWWDAFCPVVHPTEMKENEKGSKASGLPRFRGRPCLLSHRWAVFRRAGLLSIDRDLHWAEIAPYCKVWVKKGGSWAMYQPAFEALRNSGAECKERKPGMQKEERGRQFLRSYKTA